MIHLIRRSGSLVILAFMLTSCNSWLDVKPENKVLEEDLFQTREGFTRAVNGIYLGMAHEKLYGQELSCGFIEALAQMYNVQQQTTGTSNRYLPFTQYEYENPSAKSLLDDTWKKMYELIANCNNILENVPLHAEVFATEGERKDFMGSLYALRAFLHFDIFRCWGPVYNESTKTLKCIPYYKKRTSLPVPLSTAENVIGNVLADLYMADSLMFDSQGKYKMYIDNYAVWALRARVYLYIGEKEKAYKIASKLIGPEGEAKDMYPFVTVTEAQNASSPDRLYYSEQIFLLENSKRDKLYEDMFDYMLDERTFLAPTRDRIMALFPNERDYRYLQWRINPGNGKGVAFMKFAKLSSGDAIRKRSQSLLKISEVFLIMAECAPTEEERVEYLNDLRIGRGYQDGSVSEGDKRDWQATIQTEYNKEFYGEGQFFFYLKRNNVSSIPAGTGNGNIALGEAQYVLPLPESESQYR